jgi:type II secretory pathway pseudopilin PulG
MTRRTGRSRAKANGEAGYILLAVLLLLTLMLIGLSVELPRISQQIKRDKEDELVHRGKEYATAIKRYYHKAGTYPTSLEQLEDTNHLRFLRKRYKDPMNPEGEWRLIRAGEAQINIPAPNIPGTAPPGTTPMGTASPSPTPASSAFNAPTGGTVGAPSGQMGALSTQPIGTGQTFGGGPIIGVASNSKKTSIKEFNGDTEYDRWLFVYDPRLEQAQNGGGGVIIASPRAAGAPGQPGAGAPGQPGGTASPGPQPAPPAGTSPTPTPQVPQ